MQYYVLFIWGDVEPSLEGPYATEDERDQRAIELKREHGDEHGIFPLDAAGPVEVGEYSAGFFMDALGEDC